MSNEDSTGNTIAGVFTSKLVGGLFALAFGAWAIVLGSVKSDILASQNAIQADIGSLKTQVTAHEIFSAQKTAEFRADISETKRRVELLETEHRQIHEPPEK